MPITMGMSTLDSEKVLFGGEMGWNPDEWTDNDDRVRGGKSQSRLKLHSQRATFTGTLDIETLGGAGFASQRTTAEGREWDLSEFDGIELIIDTDHSDAKKYTFIFKDQILPKDPDTGREQSTISWEFDFRPPSQKSDPVKNFIAWNEFSPTYRGREVKDAEKPDLKSIKRFSIMMRSFFGSQHGDFRLTILSIAVCKHASGALDAKSSLGRRARPSPDNASESNGTSFKQDERDLVQTNRLSI